MKIGRRALALPLLALPLLWGCSASAPAEHRSADAELESDGARAKRGYAPTGPATAVEPLDGAEQTTDPGLAEPPLRADPHHARPGGHGRDAPPAIVRFQPPGALLAAVVPSRRPRMDVPLHMSLVFVRDGLLVQDSKTFLELEGRLRRETKIQAVVGLSQPRKARVDLDDLVAHAKAEGRGLLLVDVLPGPGGARRVGYLFHTDHGGVLLAVYELHADGAAAAPTSGGGAPDLCDRVGLAYAELGD